MPELRSCGSHREYRKQPRMQGEHQHSAQCGHIAMSRSRYSDTGSLRDMKIRGLYADEEEEAHKRKYS
jgi:hypothetical protein